MPERIWFVIAAAGASSRFGGSTPKPYLRIGGKSLLEHALRALAGVPGIAGGVVVTAPGDRRFRRLPKAARRGVVATVGGPTRAMSVLNGLQALVTAAPEDWVLVHDAARPCIPRADLSALVAECRRDAVGGLLAVPVRPLKQPRDDDRRARTVRASGCGALYPRCPAWPAGARADACVGGIRPRPTGGAIEGSA